MLFDKYIISLFKNVELHDIIYTIIFIFWKGEMNFSESNRGRASTIDWIHGGYFPIQMESKLPASGVGSPISRPVDMVDI
jgi:hypothetical protein